MIALLPLLALAQRPDIDLDLASWLDLSPKVKQFASPQPFRPAALPDDGSELIVSEDEKGYTNAYPLNAQGYSLNTYISAIAYEKPFLIATFAGSQPLAMLDLKQKRTWPPRFQIVGGATARDLYVLATIRAKPPRGSNDLDKETFYCSLAYVPLRGSRQRAQQPLSSSPADYRIMATKANREGTMDFLLAKLSPPKLKYHEASAVELQAWRVSYEETVRTARSAFGEFDGLKLPGTAAAVYPKHGRERGSVVGQPSIQAFDTIHKRAFYQERLHAGAEYNVATRRWTLLKPPAHPDSPVFNGFYHEGRLYLNSSSSGWSWFHDGNLFVASEDRRSWRRLGPYRVFARSPNGKYWVISGGEGKGLWLVGLK